MEIIIWSDDWIVVCSTFLMNFPATRRAATSLKTTFPSGLGENIEVLPASMIAFQSFVCMHGTVAAPDFASPHPTAFETPYQALFPMPVSRDMEAEPDCGMKPLTIGSGASAHA